MVTGASGFVAKHVIAQLLEATYSVVGTVRSAAKAEAVRAAVEDMVGPDAAGRLTFVTCDLLDDAGWAEAFAGATAVMHVATVVYAMEPRDPSVAIRPALEGTERVLSQALAAGVRRIVMTSSIATVGYGHPVTPGINRFDESHFTNIEAMKLPWAYCIGKTRAERLSWEMARTHGLELTTIHPGMILGPTPDGDMSVSLMAVSGLLDGSMPAVPASGFSVIDVRDVAAMHLAALQNPDSIGERYLATGPYLKLQDLAEMLREAYPDHNVTRRVVPDWIMRVIARFSRPMRQIANDIGVEKHYDGAKGEALLGRPYIQPREVVLATAESLFRLGLIERKR